MEKIYSSEIQQKLEKIKAERAAGKVKKSKKSNTLGDFILETAKSINAVYAESLKTNN